ncbi:MAG: FecR domain-containing protein [Bacteroidales bacterium]|nr:FecR domain-containing protein [Bacteroidales bacterium]MBN2699097.1 FecR domain-containing protein [Bacteroidales bacterium]
MINRITQYLKGELNEDQKQELADWINASKENRRYFEEIADTWYAAGISQKHIFNANEAYNRFRNHNKSHTPARGIFTLLKYAASILALISLGWIGHLVFDNSRIEQSDSFITFSAPSGETAFLEFADQTVVHLNAESSIQLPESFNKDAREVFLTGEAYFNVARNEELPFIVHLDHLDIKVLGTSFNVRSYADENTVETTLEEGLLQVICGEAENGDDNIYFLRKGQHLSFNSKTNTVQIKEENTLLYTSWKQGYYKFKKIKLDQLVRTIERVYDVDISLDQQETGNLTFSGSFFKDESVEDVLNMVEQSALDIAVHKVANSRFEIISN